jgi:hypothetical protein
VSAPLQLNGWLPAAAAVRDGEFHVDWLHFGEEPLSEPFFEDSVRRCLSRPFNQLFHRRTSMAELAEWQRQQPGLEPDGFIFHLSRCGSTLLAQMLAASPDNLVVSEAPPLDAVLREGDVDPEQRALWLRWMISALGQPRRGERRLFFKFDSWHVLDLPLIRRAFPTVPWIFLYRDPLEVLASHLAQRGSQTVPGLLSPALFGLDLAEAIRMPPHEYCAAVLAAICAAALRHHDSGARLIHYRELPQALFDQVLPHCRVEAGPAERQRMQAASHFDAKNPAMPFGRSASKLEQLSAAQRAAAEVRLGTHCLNLESLRLAQKKM